jgi:hypothetical protein
MSTLVVLRYLEKTVLYSRVSRLIVLDVKDGHTLRDVCTAATAVLGTTTQVHHYLTYSSHPTATGRPRL